MDIPQKTPEYEDLHELSGTMPICYGPVNSRRLGSSLGINLLGDGSKICSFDCTYCDLGRTKLKMSEMKKSEYFPTVDKVDQEIRERIIFLTKGDVPFKYITFSGNGEPTLYPDFSEVVTRVLKIRDDLCPDVKVAILSNGSTLEHSKTVRALNFLDERIMKVDAGNDEMLKRINTPLVRMTAAKLIQNIKKLKDATVQSLFLYGGINNTLPAEVDDWIEIIGIIKPKAVQLYSLDRVPPVTGLKQVPTQRLKEIALLLQKRTSIKGTVFS